MVTYRNVLSGPIRKERKAAGDLKLHKKRTKKTKKEQKWYFGLQQAIVLALEMRLSSYLTSTYFLAFP